LKAYNKAQQAKNSKDKKKSNKKNTKKKKKKKSNKKKKPNSSKTKQTTKQTTEKETKTADVKKPEAVTEEEEGPKPPKYFLKHRPVRYDAMLWMAKSYIELDNYDDAGRYLRLLTEKSDVPKRIKAQA
jgi:hypothetical protein